MPRKESRILRKGSRIDRKESRMHTSSFSLCFWRAVSLYPQLYQAKSLFVIARSLLVFHQRRRSSRTRANGPLFCRFDH